MALKFKCSNCGNEIYVQYLKIGEIAMCPQCGQRSEVPANAEQVDEIPGIKHDNLYPPGATSSTPVISAEMLENIDASQVYSLESSAKSVTILLWITIVILGTLIISGIIQFGLLINIKNGNAANIYSWSTTSDNLDIMITGLYFLSGLITLIVFFVWFYRAHKNLRYANVPGIEHASGWTIGGFFVPILNLFRPYQMMAETWRGSAAMSCTHDYQEFLQKPVNLRAALWWTLAIIAAVTSYIGSVIVSISDDIDSLIIGTAFTITGRIAYALFFITLIYLIREITRHQTNARKIAYIKSSTK
jgi:hypothetical protein